MALELTQEQIAAIRAAQEISEILIEDHPEIADDYRAGLTQSEIVEKYGFDEIASTRRVARQAVLLALKRLITEEERAGLKSARMRECGKRCYEEGKGVHGITAEIRRRFGEKAAQVLRERGIGIYGMTPEQRSANGRRLYEEKKGIHGMTTEQRREIGRRCAGLRTEEESREGGVKSFLEKKGVHALSSEEHSRNGKKSRDMGVGIHALTHEQRVEAGKKLHAEGKGWASLTPEQRAEIGRKVYEQGKGVHALTSEQHSLHARKAIEMGVGLAGLTPEQRKEAAMAALKARGQTPWSEEESHCCAAMIRNPEYTYQFRSRRALDRQRIADELNERFHGDKKVRTTNSVDGFCNNARTKKYLND